MTGPARITIELEPAAPIERAVANELTPVAPLSAPEQREPSVIPVGYEPPADCTCFDGFCDADHANE